jgi:glycosyltransferase involved in cell wall biosynthesis
MGYIRRINPMLYKPAPAIAAVMRAFEGGGAQRDMVLLCNALHQRGVAVMVFVLQPGGPLRSLLDPAIEVVAIPGERIRYAIPGLRKLMRARTPRMIVSSESNLNLCCLAAVRSLPAAERPKLVLREVSTPSVAQSLDPYFQNRIAYHLLRRVYRYADRIVALTRGACEDLVRNFAVPAHRVALMRSNAVVPPATEQRLARWDGEDGREAGLIVSIGRLSPEKNHSLLLRALARVDPRRAWRLAVVGDGAERAALEREAHTLGLGDRVTWVGYDADPFRWMMRASLVVCSSRYEGLGNVIIEALACGTPVVSTDCPYGPREILQDGQFGTLVPLNDAGAMARAISAALDAPVDRRALMRRGLDYSAEKAASAFLEATEGL